MKDQESTKLEFILKVNENIIVQRFFNVRGYNPNAKNSVELHEYISDFVIEFKDRLRTKSVVYMMENQFEIYENPMVMETSITDGPEKFTLTIKNGDTVMYNREINAKVYPPKIRYTVDVRPQLKELLTSLTEIFSEKKLTYEYMDYNLVG
jgi:hypothetical protein